MKRVLIGVCVALTVLLGLQLYWRYHQKNTVEINEISAIQTKIKNVGKLIVSEGTYAEIYNYKDAKEIFGNYFTATKKALVIAKAEVLITYDLSKITYSLDEEQRVVLIQNIPEPEIKLQPEFEYYDVSQDYFNKFEAKDYNFIKEKAKSLLMRKVTSSTQYKNAQNRLLSELSKFYVLTQTKGWKLKYQDQSGYQFLHD